MKKVSSSTDKTPSKVATLPVENNGARDKKEKPRRDEDNRLPKGRSDSRRD